MGETYTIREFIEKSFKKINIELEWQGVDLDEIGLNKNTGKVLIRIDKKYFRPNEVELLLSDPSKAKNILGWKPECDTLDKLIDSMLND